MEMNQFIIWIEKLVSDFGKVGSWLFSPVFSYNNISVTPILLVSFGGLISFIVIAVIKWGVN